MLDETIVVSDDQGNEIEYTILFTFENEEKAYVMYYDPEEDEPTVFASIYDDEGNLYAIEDEEEWALVEDAFNSFMSSEEAEEEEPEHECCGGHHHEGHECCGGHKHHHDEHHECVCGGHHHEGTCCEGEDCDCE